MAFEALKEVYKTPRVQIRGVFLCENVAVETSVLTGNITQEAWGGDTTLGEAATDPDGDVWLGFL
jgi:hypothetical protein